MKIVCPTCAQDIPTDQINVSTDLAFCPTCRETFQISRQQERFHISPDILKRPPKGITFNQTMDSVIIEASTRSPMALFVIPFAAVWGGGSLWGIYGTQIASGDFSLQSSLFGIPFLLGSFILIALCLMMTCGQVRIEIGCMSQVFVGIGRIGWKKTFNWKDVAHIQECPSLNYTSIKFTGNVHFTFGSMLSTPRRLYLIDALNYIKSLSSP